MMNKNTAALAVGVNTNTKEAGPDVSNVLSERQVILDAICAAEEKVEQYIAAHGRDYSDVEFCRLVNAAELLSVDLSDFDAAQGEVDFRYAPHLAPQTTDNDCSWKRSAVEVDRGHSVGLPSRTPPICEVEQAGCYLSSRRVTARKDLCVDVCEMSADPVTAEIGFWLMRSRAFVRLAQECAPDQRDAHHTALQKAFLALSKARELEGDVDGWARACASAHVEEWAAIYQAALADGRPSTVIRHILDNLAAAERAAAALGVVL